MKTILTGVMFIALFGLAACESEPQPNAAVASANASTPAAPAASGAVTAQASPADATPPPNGVVVMPNSAPPVPAYGPTPYHQQPYYFPPTGLGMP